MKRFLQTIKISLALFVAVFSNSLLPTAVAYATPSQEQNQFGHNPGNPEQPKQVFCTLSDDGKWKAQIGGSTSSNPLLDNGKPVYVNGNKDITKEMAQQCQDLYGVVEIPSIPPVNDPCGPHNATWIVPENTDTIRWTKKDGTLVAETKRGFVFNDETKRHDFGKAVDANAPCVTISKTSEPVTDTNSDGYIGVNDVVTWKITVTNISEDELDNFKVQITDSLAKLQNDGVIEHLKPGDMVVLIATSVLTATDVQACKATNTVSFEAWYNRRDNHNDKKDDKFSRNMNGENKDVITGSATREAYFTCPTPGSGSSSTSTTTTSTSVPTSLPSTGPTDGILLTPIVAAVAYGITYFIQRRRELATNN